MSKRAEIAAYNYAKENGTLGYDYNQIYDAAKNGYEQAEKDTIERVCEWLEKNVTFIHPRKGVPTCIVNLSALKEAILGGE